MTKGTKAFRIIISILLALTMLCSAFFVFLFCLYISRNETQEEEYGLLVAGIPVTSANKNDILGDGTVYYDDYNHVLTLDNATIEYADTVIYSMIDLHIQLIGDNRLINTHESYAIGVYAGNYSLNKDLALVGDGTLTIELPNSTVEAAGLSAADIVVYTDLNVITPDCESAVNGIVCDSSLIVVDKAKITVNNGSAKFSSAFRVRGNAFFEEGTAVSVTVNPGSTGICKGLSVSGDLFLGKDTVLNVSIDDSETDLGECVRVSGHLEIGNGASVTAYAKNVSAIECFGSIEANEGAVITAASDKAVDIFCTGVVVNRGAEIKGDVESLGVYTPAA